jgi:hypothetical protein
MKPTLTSKLKRYKVPLAIGGLAVITAVVIVSVLYLPHARFVTTSKKIDKELETSLHDVIKAKWGDKFNEQKWKSIPFKSYTHELDFAKMEVLRATENVAKTYKLELEEPVAKVLQNQITLDTTPETALPHMSTAMIWAKPKPIPPTQAQ